MIDAWNEHDDTTGQGQAGYDCRTVSEGEVRRNANENHFQVIHLHYLSVSMYV